MCAIKRRVFLQKSSKMLEALKHSGKVQSWLSTHRNQLCQRIKDYTQCIRTSNTQSQSDPLVVIGHHYR